MLVGLSVLCFRQCPWYLKCIVMYARYKFCGYMRWAAEAKLLFLLRDWSILSVVPIAWRPPPLVFGVELAGLLEDPTVYVGMISWFIGVAVNLAGSVQYAV